MLHFLIYDPAVATIFYATLALFALLGTWGKEGRGQVGRWLLVSYIVSNLIYWTLPVESWPTLFPFLDVLVALSCMSAWKETGSRVPLIIVGLSTMAAAVNFAFAFSILGAGSTGQGHIYVIILNLIFALQCITAGTWGLVDGGLVSFRRGVGHLRPHPEPYRGAD